MPDPTTDPTVALARLAPKTEAVTRSDRALGQMHAGIATVLLGLALLAVALPGVAGWALGAALLAGLAVAPRYRQTRARQQEALAALRQDYELVSRALDHGTALPSSTEGADGAALELARDALGRSRPPEARR